MKCINLKKMEIKKGFVVNILCLIIAICATVSRFLTNDKIDANCHDILLNMTNPFSYINKVTKPFLLELVQNATRGRIH
jgi:hypothetical protein